jgi:peptidoglycan/LPS O-acetylase OafA/YrhL
MSASSAPGRALGYRPALDGVRAIAIALVVLHHTSAFLVPSHAGSFFPGGFLGVDLFFVLSGFLITTLLLERRGRERRPIATFYLRRALRLIPALVALLLANLLYALVNGGVGDALRSIAVVLAYATNWAELAGVSISRYVTHLWSLSIEEQFYLIWPLLLYAALRRWPSQRRLVWLALGIALLAAVWRAALFQSGDPWLRIYIRTDARADALAIGAALALAPWQQVAVRFRPRARELAGVSALAVVIAAAAALQPSAAVLYDGGFTVIALAAAVLIACVLEPDTQLYRVLASRPFVVLGRLSYSLYLWHFGIFQVVAERTPAWSGAPRVAVALTLTLIAASASYLLVERPALTLKARLGRARARGRRTRPPDAAPAA